LDSEAYLLPQERRAEERVQIDFRKARCEPFLVAGLAWFALVLLVASAKMIPVGAASLRQIIKALARNELVALASDLPRGDHGVRVTFFNRPAVFPSGPAAIALKTGVPIIPAWGRRETNNLYVAEIEAPIEVSRTGDTAHDIQVTTERIVRFFERIIRQAPDQWLVFLPVWRQESRTESPGTPVQPALESS